LLASWDELGFELKWYPKFLHAATGLEIGWEELNTIADRVYTLIRAFWVRELGEKWSNEVELPASKMV